MLFPSNYEYRPVLPKICTFSSGKDKIRFYIMFSNKYAKTTSTLTREFFLVTVVTWSEPRDRDGDQEELPTTCPCYRIC